MLKGKKKEAYDCLKEIQKKEDMGRNCEIAKTLKIERGYASELMKQLEAGGYVEPKTKEVVKYKTRVVKSITNPNGWVIIKEDK